MKQVKLVVKFEDKTYKNTFKGTKDTSKSLKNFQKLLHKSKNWKWAVMYDKEGSPLHYFHPSRANDTLTQEEYKEIIQEKSVNLYIIRTNEYKRRTGEHRGKTILGVSVDDAHKYWDDDTQKIQVYQNNQIIKEITDYV